MRDFYGVEILPTDTIRIVGQGGGRNRPRRADFYVTSPVLRMGRSRLIFRDSDYRERSAEGHAVAVCRRDGQPGWEAHRGDPRYAHVGTMAILGHPNSRYLVVRRADGWYSVLTDRPIDEEDLLRMRYFEVKVVLVEPQLVAA